VEPTEKPRVQRVGAWLYALGSAVPTVVTTALLLLCILLPTSLEARGVKRYLKKESTVDMKNMNDIFLGWVDFSPDEWVLYRHEGSLFTSGVPFSKAEWIDAISSLNSLFEQSCQSRYLPGRIITASKGKGDENAAGDDLYIKFSDVRIDYDNYQLILSIHFIDPKTNSEIATIPVRPYYGNASGISEYLKAALDEVAIKIQVEVTGELQGKKKK
jgi:hypothetical protein